MDDSFHIEEGMHKARRFLLDVAEIGLPAGTEALDPIAPQYLGDLISWTAIGARTAESQTHREMSSGLSTPVGFKNATDGDLDVAVNAILSASRPHSFLGINGEGRSAIIRTRGNAYGHLVLRGGGGRPNYDTVSVALAEAALAKPKLTLMYSRLAHRHPGAERSWSAPDAGVARRWRRSGSDTSRGGDDGAAAGGDAAAPAVGSATAPAISTARSQH
jgi:phospho-2-dehydro-3-deoxyheptonate aldolase